MRFLPLFLITCIGHSLAFAQQTEPAKPATQLDEVRVVGYKTINGIGHFRDSQGQVLYAGKETEVILVDRSMLTKPSTTPGRFWAGFRD